MLRNKSVRAPAKISTAKAAGQLHRMPDPATNESPQPVSSPSSPPLYSRTFLANLLASPSAAPLGNIVRRFSLAVNQYREIIPLRENRNALPTDRGLRSHRQHAHRRPGRHERFHRLALLPKFRLPQRFRRNPRRHKRRPLPDRPDRRPNPPQTILLALHQHSRHPFFPPRRHRRDRRLYAGRTYRRLPVL